MQIVGQTWLNLVTWICGSWSEGQHDLYFTVQWFCLISWRLFDIWTPYFGIMSHHDPMFVLKIFVGHCDLYFMAQWFCLKAWRLFDMLTPYFRIMSQYDPMFDLKIIVGRCDLYFIVQWFCLIAWRLFDIWTPYFGIMSQYDLKIFVGHRPYISWSSDFALYLEHYSVAEHHTFGVWISMTRLLTSK